MAELQSAHRGCLLGLAVGDAMGYAVDSKTWAEIQEDYGPNGLLGYDLVNGYADITPTPSWPPSPPTACS